MNTYQVTLELSCECGFPVKRTVQAPDMAQAYAKARRLLAELRAKTGSRYIIKGVRAI